MIPNSQSDDEELPPLVVRSFTDLSFLVIDDSAVSCDIIEKILGSAAVGKVTKAPSIFAAAGTLTAANSKIDCIICDHHIEGMTGPGFLQCIRAGKNACTARVLFRRLLAAHLEV